MSTDTATRAAINAQTPGPLRFGDNPGQRIALIGAPSEGRFQIVCEVNGPNRGDLIPERDANRRLLAAAFTSFDRAGRTLGVDAAELAERLDLAALIQAARNAIEELERRPEMIGGSARFVAARRLRNALPPV